MSANGEIDPWATHLPVLLAACGATDGPILECGCGHNSTVILHALCAPRERPLLTLEGNREWLDKFMPLARGWHTMNHVEDWERVPRFFLRGTFDVAFVDHGVAPRGPLAAALRTVARYVVMHDSEAAYCGYPPCLGEFDWIWTFKRYDTWTSIAGMGQRLAWIEPALSPGDWGIPAPTR